MWKPIRAILRMVRQLQQGHWPRLPPALLSSQRVYDWKPHFVPAMLCRDLLPCRAASLLSMPKAARNAARAAHRVRRTVPAALAGTNLSQASAGADGGWAPPPCLLQAAAISQLQKHVHAGPTGEQ
jgi:hypothetical protein